MTDPASTPTQQSTSTPPPLRPVDLLDRFRDIRTASLILAAPLSPEDCVVQSMPDASPVKWHLAHTTWFFEEFVLRAGNPDYRCYDESFRYLYNSYYNAVGERHPRPLRGMVTRPRLEEVLGYRRAIDDAVEEFVDSGAADEKVLRHLEIGLHHEQQHQELILTDVKHLLAQNPMLPTYRRPGKGADPDDVADSVEQSMSFLSMDEGIVEVGFDGESFSFDNERGRHRVFLDAYRIGRRAVTCGEYLEFIKDGGYSKANLWLADGWDAVQSEGWEAPLYWHRRGEGLGAALGAEESDTTAAADEWRQFTLTGDRTVDLDEPVTHVSYYEADAFARWAGARLPSEAEWEHAASQEEASSGQFVEYKAWHPLPEVQGTPSGSFHGRTWEWTRSAYGAYPGFKEAEGTLGEYNGKFMCNTMVLRGGSCATPKSHIRTTYRNFFAPGSRWQFSGIRLASAE